MHGTMCSTGLPVQLARRCRSMPVSIWPRPCTICCAMFWCPPCAGASGNSHGDRLLEETVGSHPGPSGEAQH
jgi:hypothetical protein